MNTKQPDARHELCERITDYLADGGLFNPEMAMHERVRGLLLDCRKELLAQSGMVAVDRLREWTHDVAGKLSRKAGVPVPAAKLEIFLDMELDALINPASTPAREFPKPCGLCPQIIQSREDIEWHGLGNCVPICERCAGSGIEPTPAPAAPAMSREEKIAAIDKMTCEGCKAERTKLMMSGYLSHASGGYNFPTVCQAKGRQIVEFLEGGKL